MTLQPVFLISMLICLLLVSCRAQAEKMLLNMYTGISESGQVSPFDQIALVRLQEAANLAGLQVEFELKTTPSERALMLSNSEGDGELMRVANIKQLAPDITFNLLQVPEAIMTADAMVFTRRSVFQVDGWYSLQPYKNAIQQGVVLFEQAPNHVKVAHIEQGFGMLERGRVDNVLTFSLIGQQMIKKLNLTGVRMLQPPTVSVNVYPYLHKKHQHLVVPLANGLKQLKQSGRYQQIERQLLSGTDYAQ